MVCSLISLLSAGVTRKVIIYLSRPPPQLLSYAFVSLTALGRERQERDKFLAGTVLFIVKYLTFLVKADRASHSWGRDV